MSLNHMEPKDSMLCIRMTHEEKRILEQRSEAASLSISEYGRWCMLKEECAPRKTRGKHPVKDYGILGAILAALGRTRIASNLNQIAKNINNGTIEMTPEVKQAIMEACEFIKHILSSLPTLFSTC